MELIAHRGMPRLARENTIPSFALALEAGADAIELDVHVSADAIPIVHHDALTAQREKIAEKTALELGRIGIPNLDDVCDLVGRRATLYVEAKAPGSAAAIVESLGAHDVKAAVHSFDPGIIQAVRRIAPDLPVGQLVSETPSQAAHMVLFHGLRDLWPEHAIVDPVMVQAVHSVGGRVIAWTVNDPEEAQRLQAAGVDGICTDDVRLLRSALGL